MIAFLMMSAACLGYVADPYEDGWKCYDEGPMTVKYTDTGNAVPGLPFFTAFMAEWDSWQVINLAASIILKEKMGITLLGCGAEHPVDGELCYDAVNNYPNGMFDQMETGRVDINLEVWPQPFIIAKVEDRLFAKKLANLGPNGIRSVEGFITADYDDTWTLGNFKGMKTAAMKAQLTTETHALFNHFKGKLAGGVFKKYSQPWARSAMANGDVPDFIAPADHVPTKPIIFSIGWGWGCTKWTFDVLHDLGMHEHYDLWHFKTEGLAIEMMTYAKAQGLHYVTYVWEPSFAFGAYQKQLVSGKLPQVPGCDKIGQCDLPASNLLKVGSNNLGRVPEVKEFFTRFGFRTNIAMNSIIYDKIHNGLEWRDATCNWIKANEAEWAMMVVPINRIENTDPWWKIWIQIGGVALGGLFVGALVYQLWRTLRIGEKYQKQTLKEKWKKEAKMELAIQAMYIAFESLDVGSTCYATYTCFTIAGDNSVMVAGFVVVLILEVGAAIFIVNQRFRLLQPAFDKLKGTWKPMGTGMNKDDVDNFVTGKVTALMWRNAVHDRYQAELLQFLAGIAEDWGAIILYTFVFVEGYMETSFVIGSIMSCIGFGYKMASLEKMQIWKAKHPFNVDPVDEDEKAQLDVSEGVVHVRPSQCDDSSKSKDD